VGTLPRREEPLHHRRQHLRDRRRRESTNTIQALALHIADTMKKNLATLFDD